MKRLYLLRHAKSSWGDPRLGDFDRPLAKRGREACKLLAVHIREQVLQPDLVECSTATRARATLDRIMAAGGHKWPVRYRDELYLAAPAILLQVVRGAPPECRSLLLIGHNPGLEQFALALAGQGEKDATTRLAQKYPTGGLAAFSCPVRQWKSLRLGDARLESFVTPADLSEIY